MPVVALALALPAVPLLAVSLEPDAARLDRQLHRLVHRQADVGVPGCVVALAVAPAAPVADQTERHPRALPDPASSLARLAGHVPARGGSGVGPERRARRRVGIVESDEQKPDVTDALSEVHGPPPLAARTGAKLATRSAVRARLRK